MTKGANGGTLSPSTCGYSQVRSHSTSCELAAAGSGQAGQASRRRRPEPGEGVSGCQLPRAGFFVAALLRMTKGGAPQNDKRGCSSEWQGGGAPAHPTVWASGDALGRGAIGENPPFHTLCMGEGRGGGAEPVLRDEVLATTSGGLLRCAMVVV